MRASRRSRVLAVLGLLITAAACETPTGISDPVSPELQPNFAISDAAHGGVAGFYFLPPTIKKRGPFAGTFDASLSPVVRICRWVDDACAGSDIVLDESGKGAQRVRMKGQSYGVLWKDTRGLTVGDVYRLRVHADAAATKPLGFADLMVVAKNRDEKRVPAGFIGLARGLPFHIKFRIEEGAAPAPDPEPEPEPDLAPAVAATTPADGAVGVARDANIDVTFDEPVDVTGDWFEIACTTSGTRTTAATTVSGGPTSFTIDPNVDFAVGESCVLTVFAAQVTDQDADDPPDNMTADHVFEFSVVAVAPPVPVDDGPAENSAPGDPFHAHIDVPIQVLPPGLLANDFLGAPAGEIVSFGGGSLGGSAGSFPAGETVNFGLNGELTVLANGGVAFRPSSGFAGSFTFQYRLANEHGSADATVTIFIGERF